MASLQHPVMDTQLHSSDDGYERTTKVVLDGEILRIFLIAAIKVRLNDRDLVVEMSEKLYYPQEHENGHLEELPDPPEDSESIEELSIRERVRYCISYHLRDSYRRWTNRWYKLDLRHFEYDGTTIKDILKHVAQGQLEAFDNNPYNLSWFYYLLVFVFLIIWAVGSVMVGHAEARLKIQAGEDGYMAALARGFIGGIPAIVQITLFLFPPLIII